MKKGYKSQTIYFGMMICCVVALILILAGGLDHFICKPSSNVGFINMMKGLMNTDKGKLIRAESALQSSGVVNEKCGIYGLALLAMYENNNLQAISLWENIIESDVDQRQALFLLGNTWWHMGNDIQAFHYWREAGAQAYWTAQADWYRTEGNTEEALQFYQRALLIDPEWDPAQRGQAVIYHDQIGALWEAERFETAITLLLQVIDLNPRQWDYVRLGDYARDQGNGEEAKRWYTQGRAIFPNFVFFPIRLGQIALDNNDWPAADANFIEAIQIDATNAQAFFLLGTSYFEQGKYFLAEEAFLTKNELLPDEWGYARLGDVYIAQGRLQDAKNAYQRALNFLPEFEYAHRQIRTLDQ